MGDKAHTPTIYSPIPLLCNNNNKKKQIKSLQTCCSSVCHRNTNICVLLSEVLYYSGATFSSGNLSFCSRETKSYTVTTTAKKKGNNKHIISCCVALSHTILSIAILINCRAVGVSCLFPRSSFIFVILSPALWLVMWFTFQFFSSSQPFALQQQLIRGENKYKLWSLGDVTQLTQRPTAFCIVL